MDTGLARDGTSAYYIERVALNGTSGAHLATLEMFEPVSEDSTLTLLVRLPEHDLALEIEGRDTNGVQYKSRIPAPWRHSELGPAASASPAP